MRGRPPRVGRLGLFTLLVALAIALLPGGLPSAGAGNDKTAHITIMGTSDLHGYVFNWDYFNNAPYSDGTGIARVSSLVEQVRADRGRESTLLFDSGDTIQGSLMAHYYAKVDPFTANGTTLPMAAAMNAIGYDAMAVGNHEFNYGVPLLRAFQSQLTFPILGANVFVAPADPKQKNLELAFEPYVIKSLSIKGTRHPVRVGIVGLTTPGSAIWDKDKVTGLLQFGGGLEAAKKWVPIVDRKADVVVVIMHSGTGSGSSYGDQIPYPENFATTVAEEVPGIDAIVPGHSHSTIDERFVGNLHTGEQVLISQPGSWGRNLTVMDFDLVREGGAWNVVTKRADALDADSVPDDPKIVSLLSAQHDRVVAYANGPIGTSTARMTVGPGRYSDVAAIDFVNYVQAETVKAGLAGTPYAGLPVVSSVGVFNTSAVIPEGQVTLRDVASLYIYDNTLLAVKLTGAQLKDYLERSVQWFRQVAGPGPFTRQQVSGIGPSYNYDAVRGISYDVELSVPVGNRIRNLSYAGQPIDPNAEFVLALNNYRQNGGGDFPHVATAPIVYDQALDIRDLLVEYVREHPGIDPATFASVDWKLVYQGSPIVVTG
jgi:2',3'-cyclic-nucleotide 2'-phosphodiesterase/3'-nucleotidase